jgi:hypothetical protein
VKADIVMSTSICGLPKGIAWLPVSDDVYVLRAYFFQMMHTYTTSIRFLLFLTLPPHSHARASAKPL